MSGVSVQKTSGSMGGVAVEAVVVAAAADKNGQALPMPVAALGTWKAVTDGSVDAGGKHSILA